MSSRVPDSPAPETPSVADQSRLRRQRYGLGAQVREATFGIAVRDLDQAIAWYRAALELGEPDVIPLPGIVEFDLGPCWLQLAVDVDRAGRSGTTINFSVTNAALERGRLAASGLQVTELRRFEGAVEFFELTDPDGNLIGFVTELN